MRRAVYFMLLCGLTSAAVGCGGGGVAVTGKVVNGGSPYTLAEGEGLSINLTKEDGGGAGGGTVQKDGTFKIAGPEGAGLPAGKYKVTVTHYPSPQAGKPGAAPSPPKTKDAKEVWDVSSNKSFDLDFAKYK